MTGRVDEAGRALLTVTVRHPTDGADATFEAWVDTGFNGFLVLPREQIAALGLPATFGGQAVLADGSQIELATHIGLVDWFGESHHIAIIASDAKTPLLGVGLLLGRKLVIDYVAQTLTLD